MEVYGNLANAQLVLEQAEHDDSGCCSSRGITTLSDVMALNRHIINRDACTNGEMFKGGYGNFGVEPSTAVNIHIFIVRADINFKIC